MWKEITLSITLTNSEASALAEFIKRLSYNDCLEKTVRSDSVKADEMIQAFWEIRNNLEKQWFSQR